MKVNSILKFNTVEQNSEYVNRNDLEKLTRYVFRLLSSADNTKIKIRGESQFEL